MPLISIIIPIYNAGKYIHKCLNSILAQTYTKWEAILVDDGSLDNSGVVCDEYATKDTRFKVVHKKNEGVSTARNEGIKQANGSWIAFIDADDYIGVNYLYDLQEEAKQKYDFTIQGFTRVRNGQIISQMIYPDEIFLHNNFTRLFNETRLYGFPWGRLYNTNIIRTNGIIFDKKISCGEDAIFMYEYILFCNNIKFISKTDYFYEQRTSTLSQRYNTFDSEYYYFARYNEVLSAIAKKYGFNNTDKSLLFGGTLLARAIQSLYQGRYSHKERIEKLKIIKTNNKSYFKKYYQPGTITLKFLKLLFLCNITLYDLLCNLKVQRYISK